MEGQGHDGQMIYVDLTGISYPTFSLQKMAASILIGVATASILIGVAAFIVLAQVAASVPQIHDGGGENLRMQEVYQQNPVVEKGVASASEIGNAVQEFPREYVQPQKEILPVGEVMKSEAGISGSEQTHVPVVTTTLQTPTNKTTADKSKQKKAKKDERIGEQKEEEGEDKEEGMEEEKEGEKKGNKNKKGNKKKPKREEEKEEEKEGKKKNNVQSKGKTKKE